MIHIQTRLDPPGGDSSRSARKYSRPLINEAISLAYKIGIRRAAKETGVNHRRLIRLCLAERRIHQTLPQALEEMKNWCIIDKCKDREHAHALLTAMRNRLIMQVETVREAYQLANRVGCRFWPTLYDMAQRRGLNPKQICELVREGRIARQWYSTQQ